MGISGWRSDVCSSDLPERLDGEIVQPFFVLGSARAGTTFTQMILTMDDGHRTPRYRDVQHPSPPRGLDPAADARALAEQDDYVAYMLGKSPRMMSAHPYLDQKGDSEAEDEYVYYLDFDLAYPQFGRASCRERGCQYVYI